MAQSYSALKERIGRLERVAANQAEDDGLWFVAQTASEAYLQQALRHIHALIEGEEAIARLTAAEEGQS